ncbi:Skp1 family, tetramerization domain protein [Oesophagostomum dentatum]|uniref:Elongin-C n=1 Tax=Oesophagostomum dentatum TaxID=61180 RepID=A0A0B1TAX2_OESDE|nr:Skp1 family, tetramerization domain protein [Oesophagostomum dentatum]
MVKDRLVEFQSLSGKTRSNSRNDRRISQEAAKLLRDEEETSLEGFLNRMTDLRNIVGQLESWLEEVRILHGELLLAPATDGEKSKQLRDIMENFRATSMVAREKIKKLDNEVNSKSHPDESKSVDSRIKRNQVRSLTRALHDVMWKFSEEEENYKERCKKKITDYLKIQDISLTDDEISDAIENGDIFERTKGILLAYSDKKALFEDVKMRRDELFEIEKVIRELGEMFVDLNNLVMSQGEMLDRIETNIEDAVDYAEKARQNVKDARELQKKARKICSVKIYDIEFSEITFTMSASSSSTDGKETKTYGGCEGPDATYVKLVSSDGHQFYIKKELALTSGTIKAMLSGPGQYSENESNEVNFREIPSHVLQKVCQYFAYKVRYTSSATEIPEFNITPEVALELLMAANFLDC